jgi:hypothetical protein
MDTIPRREYRCLLGEGLLYRENNPNYYFAVGVTLPYQYNVNILGCIWCPEKDKCISDMPKILISQPTLIRRTECPPVLIRNPITKALPIEIPK